MWHDKDTLIFENLGHGHGKDMDKNNIDRFFSKFYDVLPILLCAHV